MPKLFTAIDLPETATSALDRLRPDPAPGIRSTKPDQMHLTLHFLGEAEIARSVDALLKVSAPSFELTLKGVGRFPSAQGTTTLWAGVEVGPGLRALHEAIGAAIVASGYPREQRPYNPHITLARCEPATQAQVVDDFCSKHAGFVFPSVRVLSFGLFSSTTIDGVPTYRRERAFELG